MKVSSEKSYSAILRIEASISFISPNASVDHEAGYSVPRIPERTLGWRITLARIHTRFMHTWTYLTVATAYTRRRLRGRER